MDDKKSSNVHRLSSLPKDEIERLIVDLEKEMKQAAKELEFEKAAMLRDRVMELRNQYMGVDDKTPEWERARKLARLGVSEDTDDAPAAKPIAYNIGKKPAKAKPGPARERKRK